MDGPIAVSGAAGFVGSHVVSTLIDAGFEVRGLLGPADTDPVTHSSTAGPAGASMAAATSWARGDVRDHAAVDAWLEGCAAVVHLAGPPSVWASFADPAGTVDVHVRGTSVVLHAARAAGVGRFVHVSSAEVYGLQRHQPVAESAVPAPRSPYAAAKLGAEALVAASARSGGPVAITLRPFSVYGPGQPGHTVLSGLLDAARAGRRLAVADPTPVRDFVHVDDVAAAVLAACRSTPPPGDPPGGEGQGGGWEPWRALNVASGRGRSIGEVAAVVAAHFGDDRPVEVTGTDRPADIPVLVGDTTAAAAALGLPAPTDLEGWIAGTSSGATVDGTTEGEDAGCG